MRPAEAGATGASLHGQGRERSFPRAHKLLIAISTLRIKRDFACCERWGYLLSTFRVSERFVADVLTAPCTRPADFLDRGVGIQLGQ